MSRLIWTSEIDSSKEAIDAYRAQLEEDDQPVPADDYAILAMMDDDNMLQLHDIKELLDVELPGQVICIANMGLWNGRKAGYALLGENLNTIFDAPHNDTTTFVADGFNIRYTDIHHDGTNYGLFRMLRPNMNHEGFLWAAGHGGVTPSDIRRHTISLLPYVADVFGWSYPKTLTKI